MLPDLHATIVALSTPHSPGVRGIVRLSGADAWPVARSVAPALKDHRPACRSLIATELRLPDVHSPLPADLYFWPAPRTYTGQDLIEIHTLSCPPLLDQLIGVLLSRGARGAQPGEFTMRAFLAGKLDLTQAEAVLGVIEAQDRDELKQALTLLAGGAARPLEALREDLLNLLADVEAGLDFAEEDIRFVQQKETLDRLARAMAQVTLVRRQMSERALGARAFQAVLAGPPNAGKSSLLNALVGRQAALVSPLPGTTRDFVEVSLPLDDLSITLTDVAGSRDTADGLEQAAQGLGMEQLRRADAVIWCREASSIDEDDLVPDLVQERSERVIRLATKCDLALPPTGWLSTSAVSGVGIEDLKSELKRRVHQRHEPALAPSLSRCRGHVDLCIEHLRRAHAIVLNEDAAELLALELRVALEELGAIVGAVYTDDLLDRIFSRFCIGK